MGRVLRLVLLGLISFIIGLVWLMPAAPLAARLAPDLQPLELERVSGRAVAGEAALARYRDDLLPLTLQDVRWRLTPSSWLGGALGARVSFAGYGGTGSAQVARGFGGTVSVSDASITLESAQLVPLLPVPVALFAGEVDARFDKLEIGSDGQLEHAQGTLQWREALFQTPISARLGTVDLAISPDGDGHTATLRSNGGHVALEGSATLAGNGDFTVDVLITPASDAPRPLSDYLRRIARPDSGGRYRYREEGNIHRLM